MPDSTERPARNVPYGQLQPGTRYSITVTEGHIDMWITGRFYGYGDHLTRYYRPGNHAKFDIGVIRLRAATGSVRFDALLDDRQEAAA